jgi:hypothetical protein
MSWHAIFLFLFNWASTSHINPNVLFKFCIVPGVLHITRTITVSAVHFFFLTVL